MVAGPTFSGLDRVDGHTAGRVESAPTTEKPVVRACANTPDLVRTSREGTTHANYRPDAFRVEPRRCHRWELMAVSKRLRFEILRRDNYTCRYCGDSPPDVKLTVDHVMPRALGGTDDPSNLVAACGPCNSGKSSATPDAPVVIDVAESATQWAEAKATATRANTMYAGFEDEISRVDAEWYRSSKGGDWAQPLPSDWKLSVRTWMLRGLPIDTLCGQIQRTRSIGDSLNDPWRFLCSAAWKEIARIEEDTKALYDDQTSGHRDDDYPEDQGFGLTYDVPEDQTYGMGQEWMHDFLSRIEHSDDCLASVFVLLPDELRTNPVCALFEAQWAGALFLHEMEARGVLAEMNPPADRLVYALTQAASDCVLLPGERTGVGVVRTLVAEFDAFVAEQRAGQS